jgi:hypothetical protein
LWDLSSPMRSFPIVVWFPTACCSLAVYFPFSFVNCNYNEWCCDVALYGRDTERFTVWSDGASEELQRKKTIWLISI